MPRAIRPRLGVWKLASCDGCQLTLLNCEGELLAIAREIEIAAFLEASRDVGGPPYDISLVEGSITTPDDAERIQTIRRSSRCLVAIGACATAGGIQALRNFSDVRQLAAAVYPKPELLQVLDRSTPVSDHVSVDHALGGCPVSKQQLLGLLSALLQGRRPHIPQYSVCVECKGAGHVCVLVAHGTPCLGPVTRAGCGAICPRFRRGCYGCFGPKETPDTASLRRIWERCGVASDEIDRAFLGFNAWAEDFRREGESRGE
jgi:coenzyme F420-reducing hydrogenase gamma subunit